ncbi:hypothetical protein CEXT_470581 [Caerostris extrusa]|uniref:Uncharacterized protein n=1 Tax=Caerostris extrusa TaxID=172846 RepID=A0AAV4RZQ4_CAEEX|nr:hypothetical protein CEXT_470581 [Caerostris extrusa]
MICSLVSSHPNIPLPLQYFLQWVNETATNVVLAPLHFLLAAYIATWLIFFAWIACRILFFLAVVSVRKGYFSHIFLALLSYKTHHSKEILSYGMGRKWHAGIVHETVNCID